MDNRPASSSNQLLKQTCPPSSPEIKCSADKEQQPASSTVKASLLKTSRILSRPPSAIQKCSADKEQQLASSTVKASLLKTTRIPSRPPSAIQKPEIKTGTRPQTTSHHIPGKPEEEKKAKLELRSSIMKPNRTDYNRLTQMNRNSSIPLRMPRGAVTTLHHRTFTTKTEENRNIRSSIVPKPRAVNTMTSSLPSKPSANQRSSLSKTNKNSTLLTKAGENQQNTKELELLPFNEHRKSNKERDSLLQMTNNLLEKKREFLSCFKKYVESPDVKAFQPHEMVEIKKIVDLLGNENINLSSIECESGAGEITVDMSSSDNMEDISEIINDLATRIRTVPSSTMNFCREVMFQKEKLINDCLSKIEDASQNNFDNIRNELKDTLTVYNTEGCQLTNKLNILETQQLEVIGSLVADITHLIQEKHRLLDVNKRLSITQDKYHEDLQCKIDFLTCENENASIKLTETVKKFEEEKSKMEADFKAMKLSDNTITETRRLLLHSESVLNTQVKKINTLEMLSKTLERAVKMRENSLERELKKYKDITLKSQDQSEIVQDMNTKLEEEQTEKLQLEEKIKLLEEKMQELEGNFRKECTLKCDAENKAEKVLEDYSELEKAYREKTKDFENLIKSMQPDSKSNACYLDIVDKQSHEISAKDVEIRLLKKKIAELNEDIEKMNAELSGQTNDRARYTEEAASLHIQLSNLHHTLQDVTKEKEKLEKIMVQKALELEQRDHVLHTQTRSLVMRDELIQILKTRDECQEEAMSKLRAKGNILDKDSQIFSYQMDSPVIENEDSDYYSGSNEASKNFCFGSGRMSDLYTMLENKQIMIMRLERRLNEWNGIHEKTEQQRIKHEARINELEQALNEKCLTNPGLIPILVQ